LIGGELRLPVPNSDIANVRQQTPPEELANTVTHGIGVIFSIGGLIFLVMKAVAHGTAAEPYRLGAVSNRLGACDPWVCFKGDLPAAFCETDLVFVFGDGMADRFRGRGNFREFVTTHHSPLAIRWLVAGGLCYSIGIIFFILDRIKYMHAVWHVFVLAGSICHFLAVFYGVIQTGK